MKKIPKQEYTAEFKELAVKRALEVGAGTTGRELGLVEQTVRNWVKAAAAGEVPPVFRLPTGRSHAARFCW